MGPATIALSLRRVLLSGALGLALLIPASVIPGPGSAATCLAASGSHRVAVALEHGDGGTLLRCVSFSTDTISGADAVHRSGIESGTVTFGGFGLAVCQLDGEPASYPPSCWTGTSPFWALFVARGGGSWQTSSLGMSNLALHDGDALGFRYESQSAQPAPPSIAGRCPDPTPPPVTPRPVTPPPVTPRPTVRPVVTPAPPIRTHEPTPATPSPGTPSPEATDPAGAPGASPQASSEPSADAVAEASDAPDASPAPAGAPGATPGATTLDAAPVDATGSSGGGPPIGLVLAAVAGLAFLALGLLHLRRTP